MLTLLHSWLQVILDVVLSEVLHKWTVARQVQQTEVQGLTQEILLLLGGLIPLRPRTGTLRLFGWAHWREQRVLQARLLALRLPRQDLLLHSCLSVLWLRLLRRAVGRMIALARALQRNGQFLRLAVRSDALCLWAAEL